MRLPLQCLLLGSLLLSLNAVAAKPADNAATADASVITEHQVKINGDTVRYRAVAGETQLSDDKEQPWAGIYSVSYFRTDIRPSEYRPVTFVFNGGPGSASVWLHLGLYGPKRIEVPGDAKDDGAAPFRLIDNTHSMLDVSDLVFIDPVGTGYSRAMGEYQGKDFWGVKEDARVLAEFVRVWLNEHDRWNSPKYLAGESYGTARAAALVNQLQGGWTDIAVNGVMLISSILDFSHARYQPGNHQPYIGYLPTMAATAFYHGKVSAADNAMGLEAFVEASRQFALNDYALALLAGSRLDPKQYQAVRKQLARFTGLDEAYLDRVNLRVSGPRFSKQLLRAQDLTVGRLDSRYTGKDYDAGGEYADNDPSGYGIDAAYTAAINHYLRGELGVTTSRRFNVLSGDVYSNWNWEMDNGQPKYVNVAPYLGKAQRENSDFRIFVANGYFDLATPFFATENTIADNGIDAKRVEMQYYPSGHMMYVEPQSLAKLADDLRRFYQSAEE
ncbi:S10 family peptidase [Shewanella sp. GXUN23E]|uniref:S10 family peptidase n=1 Tax=Shewanella sp. GXUN23E TaxID=3422498 RepID=UPI003D7CB8EC